MPAQGEESPHPESSARAIFVFCEARSNAPLMGAARDDRSIKLARELMANRTTDIDFISSHMRSVQPRAFGRKFRIAFVVESEAVAYEPVGALSMVSYTQSASPNKRERRFRSTQSSEKNSNLQPYRYERQDIDRVR
jgi:hypothetical protein